MGLKDLLCLSPKFKEPCVSSPCVSSTFPSSLKRDAGTNTTSSLEATATRAANAASGKGVDVSSLVASQCHLKPPSWHFTPDAITTASASSSSSSSADDMMSSLLARELPCCVSVLKLSGEIIAQNALSHDFYNDGVSSTTLSSGSSNLDSGKGSYSPPLTPPCSRSLLPALFQIEGAEAEREMWEVVMSRREWRRVMRVARQQGACQASAGTPACHSSASSQPPCLAAAAAAECSMSPLSEGHLGAGACVFAGSPATASGTATQASSGGSRGEEEEEGLLCDSIADQLSALMVGASPSGAELDTAEEAGGTGNDAQTSRRQLCTYSAPLPALLTQASLSHPPSIATLSGASTPAAATPTYHSLSSTPLPQHPSPGRGGGCGTPSTGPRLSPQTAGASTPSGWESMTRRPQARVMSLVAMRRDKLHRTRTSSSLMRDPPRPSASSDALEVPDLGLGSRRDGAVHAGEVSVVAQTPRPHSTGAVGGAMLALPMLGPASDGCVAATLGDEPPPRQQQGQGRGSCSGNGDVSSLATFNGWAGYVGEAGAAADSSARAQQRQQQGRSAEVGGRGLAEDLRAGSHQHISSGRAAAGPSTVGATPAGDLQQLPQQQQQQQQPLLVWHEVTVKIVEEPISGRPALLVVQRDVTQRAQLEGILEELSNTQLAMLSQIFPRHVIEAFAVADGELDMGSLARHHPNVTILFMDIVGFTTLCKGVSPARTMSFLNELFGHFDRLLDEHGVHKVETAGDAYIVSSGVLATDAEGFSRVVEGPQDPRLNAQRMMRFAKAMIQAASQVRMPHNGQPVKIRIGIHSGCCSSGLVGCKLPKFAIFGDTMNTASRMESTCQPGLIQVSEATRMLLDPEEPFQPTGGIEVKGKGFMQTYLWHPPAPPPLAERATPCSAQPTQQPADMPLLAPACPVPALAAHTHAAPSYGASDARASVLCTQAPEVTCKSAGSTPDDQAPLTLPPGTPPGMPRVPTPFTGGLQAAAITHSPVPSPLNARSSRNNTNNMAAAPRPGASLMVTWGEAEVEDAGPGAPPGAWQLRRGGSDMLCVVHDSTAWPNRPGNAACVAAPAPGLPVWPAILQTAELLLADDTQLEPGAPHTGRHRSFVSRGPPATPGNAHRPAMRSDNGHAHGSHHPSLGSAPCPAAAGASIMQGLKLLSRCTQQGAGSAEGTGLMRRGWASHGCLASLEGQQQRRQQQQQQQQQQQRQHVPQAFEKEPLSGRASSTSAGVHTGALTTRLTVQQSQQQHHHQQYQQCQQQQYSLADITKLVVGRTQLLRGSCAEAHHHQQHG